MKYIDKQVKFCVYTKDITSVEKMIFLKNKFLKC